MFLFTIGGFNLQNVEITERDKKLFEYLFRFRYATSDQIVEYMGLSYDVFRKRISKLISSEYIESVNMPGYLNKKVYSNGVKIRAEHERKSYRRRVAINHWSLHHHLKINDTYLHFIKKYGIEEDKVTTEREMYWKRTGLLTQNRDIKKLKMPDLVIEDDECLIAVEVEENKKSKTLMREVFRNYSLYTSFYCIRYICPTKAFRNWVKQIAKEERITFVDAFTYDEFVKGKDMCWFLGE